MNGKHKGLHNGLSTLIVGLDMGICQFPVRLLKIQRIGATSLNIFTILPQSCFTHGRMCFLSRDHFGLDYVLLQSGAIESWFFWLHHVLGATTTSRALCDTSGLRKAKILCLFLFKRSNFSAEVIQSELSRMLNATSSAEDAIADSEAQH